jgi:hypothetical protein
MAIITAVITLITNDNGQAGAANAPASSDSSQEQSPFSAIFI